MSDAWIRVSPGDLRASIDRRFESGVSTRAGVEAVGSTSGRTLLFFDAPPDVGAVDLLDRFETSGFGVLDTLRGAFALAILDTATGRISLARDRLGIRPLYRAVLGNGEWAISTSIRGLIAAGTPPRIDRRGLQSFLRMGAVYEPRTFLEGARAVLPATWETIDEGDRVESMRWWTLDERNGAPDVSCSDLYDAVVDGVRANLPPDGTVGVLASGGSDSSGLLLTLEDLDALPVHTISLGFGGPDADTSEHPHQRACAERFGTTHHEWLATADSVESLLPDFFDAMDQPTVDGLNSFLAARIAGSIGVDTLLSGFGGDEVFAGYGSFRSVSLATAGTSILRRCPDRLRRGLARAIGIDDRRPERAKLAALVETAPDLDDFYALRRSLFLPAQVERLTGIVSPLEETLTRHSNPDAETLSRWSVLELQNHLPNTLLRASDRASRAHGVALRFPYIDHRLVELASRIPARRKVDHAHRKPLMRDVFEDRLPDFVWARNKRHFQVPIDRWLMRSTFEFPEVPGLDPAEVDRVVAAYRRRPDLRTSSRAWAIYVLGQTLPRLLGPVARATG